MKLRYTKYLTDEKYDALAKFDWLKYCGEELNDESYVTIESVEVATSMIESVKYENFQLDRQADLTVYLTKRHPNEYSDWNAHVDHSKAKMFQVFKIIEDRCKALNFNKVVYDTIAWDVIGYFQELVYLKFKKPGFYHELMSLYEIGRMPCGYTGDYPKGKICIY